MKSEREQERERMDELLFDLVHQVGGGENCVCFSRDQDQ
jgi:hypothetical protein